MLSHWICWFSPPTPPSNVSKHTVSLRQNVVHIRRKHSITRKQLQKVTGCDNEIIY